MLYTVESTDSPRKMEKKVSKPVIKNKENKKNVSIDNLPTEDIRKTTNNNGIMFTSLKCKNRNRCISWITVE